MKCKYSKYCGGCDDIELNYDEHLENKITALQDIFQKITDKEISEVIKNYYPLKYRNKIHLAFTELKGKTLIGFFEENSTKVVDINECMLFGDWAKILIEILREYVSRFKLRAYKDGVGILRYAHARCIDNRLQLTLVVTTDNFAGRSWLYNKLCSNFNDVSFYLNINRRTDRAVFDNRFKYVNGNKYLEFEIMGLKVNLTPSSFLQVNLPVAIKMYKKANELLEISSDTTVIDLYSGIGITSMMFAKTAKQVFSIEEVESAVQNAKYMAKINNLHNINIIQGKCEDSLAKIKSDNLGDVVVFVDPARAGLDRSVIDYIKNLNPRKIVYMSCNPETCVSDCKILLSDNKYTMSNIIAGDMFPYTKHIETIVCMQKA